MRISKKKELINCIDTLKKGNNDVLKIDSGSCMDFLTQCQEMAIMVGTEIDRIEGEGVVTVSYLEQYCEEIYQMSVTTDRGELIQEQKRVHRLLLQIKESIQSDIPDSPAEIVFMPYKASMWDALDSVYHAAVQAKKCNVIVMPIPYYSINPKGEILSVEYEGNLFPTDISITDFRKVNLEQLHPDIIFIHNPYDEWNRVTQVPNEYFSSTLIHQTEHLIYIPYFVTTGEKMKDDYCYLPAVRNAWRTFVQSDAVRNCYIKNGADPRKIVAMGSPKFDMVIKYQNNPPIMPEEWKNKFAGKYVFFLNTHLNAIINSAETLFSKLQLIFHFFEENSNIAILWRPHPLSVETVKAMNPKMLSEYLQLVKEFQKLPNGVYDDTPDIHRAIAISDAYIGHWSSIVALYEITKKPIYILEQNKTNNILQNENEKYLQFSCGVEVDGWIWTAAELFNGIYKVNCQTGECIWVDTFEQEEKYAKELYRNVVAYNDYLLFVPWRAKYFVKYSIVTGEQIVLKTRCGNDAYLPKISDAILEGEDMFLLPAREQWLIKWNLNSNEQVYHRECCKQLENLEYKYITFKHGVVYEDTLYAVSGKVGCWTEGDIKNFEFHNHFIADMKGQLCDLCIVEDMFYFLDTDGNILKKNKYEEKYKTIWKYQGDRIRPFERIVYSEDCLWLLPSSENKIFCLDMKNGMEIHLEYPQDYIHFDITKPKTWNYIKREKELLLCPGSANGIISIDCAHKTVKLLKCIYSCQSTAPNMQEAKRAEGKSCVYYEGTMSLEQFVKLYSEECIDKKNAQKIEKLVAKVPLQETCGEKIWNYIMKDLERGNNT